MARRASSSLHPGIIIGIFAAIIVVVIAGKGFLGKKAPGAGDADKLKVEDLLENGNSLRGNEYVVEGKIDRKLRWTANRGQVVSLRVKTSGGDEFIGVEIPPSFDKFNIEREQRYEFRVKFQQGGVPVATAIKPL